VRRASTSRWRSPSSFRLTDEQEAATILREVIDATSGWRRAASAAGLSASEIDRMARAFEHEEAARAREVVTARLGT
jgi:stress response protein SCP2